MFLTSKYPILIEVLSSPGRAIALPLLTDSMNYETKALTESPFIWSNNLIFFWGGEYNVSFLNFNFVAHFSAPSSPLPLVAIPRKFCKEDCERCMKSSVLRYSPRIPIIPTSGQNSNLTTYSVVTSETIPWQCVVR